MNDSLIILGRNRQPTTALQDLLVGRSAFLLCGGPSANELPLGLLAKRGLWVMAVNNAAGHPLVRPQAFVCADPPSKFSHSIWLDPAIMKFIPIPKLSSRRGVLRKKLGGGFSLLGKDTTQCPNVWAFQRESWLSPDDAFFASQGALWGNHEKGCRKTGQSKTVCTMLLGLRLLHYLGASRVYLVGVDFRMTPEKGYSFEQSRDAGAAATNTEQYRVVNGWLCEMQGNGTFQRAGMGIYNCYRNSGLRAFPHVPFEKAIEESQGLVEDAPDLGDWYQK